MSVILGNINIEKEARGAGIAPSTLSYDLKKIKDALPDALTNQKPGPKPQNKPDKAVAVASQCEEPILCPLCGGRATKNGTYWVLNWLLMLMLG